MHFQTFVDRIKKLIQRISNGVLTPRRLRKLKRMVARRSFIELLETRTVFTSGWQNPMWNLDVDFDGNISPLDALAPINEFNRQNGGGTKIDFTQPVGDNNYLDVDGDLNLSPLDILNVINYLNASNTSIPTSLSLSVDSGASATDRITNSSIVNGLVTDNSSVKPTVKARLDRGTVVPLTLSANNTFVFDTSSGSPILDGNRFATVFVQSADGRIGYRQLQFTLDTTAPSTSVFDIDPSDDTGRSASDGLTRINRPKVNLVTEPNTFIQVTVDSTVLFNGITTGTFSQATSILADGARQLNASLTDIAGNTRQVTRTISIDATVPAIPVFDLSASSDTGVVGDKTTRNSRVTLLGTTEANSFISINGSVDSFRTAGDGSFTIPSVTLNVGTNNLQLSVSDLAGNTSIGSQSFTRVNEAAVTDPVLTWNQAIINAIQLDATTPPVATRGMAMMSIAMLDTLNAIEKTPSYLVSLPAPANVSTAAAMSTAAYEVLKYLYPAQQQSLDAVQANVLGSITDATAKANGIAFGTLVANAVVTLRKQDGWDRFVDYTPSSSVGEWQQTAPMYDQAQLPQWGDLIPFGVSDIDAIIPSGPPSLNSDQWSTAFNEVKSLGSATSTTRTADQTQQARFWADGSGTATPPGHWNQIATQIATDKNLSLGENARLFATLNIALSDSSIAAWKTKYTKEFWRPITAIREADTDSNSATAIDPNWSPLLITPPHPEYVSGHSTYSAAASRVLASYFGDNQFFTTTSPGLANVTRSYTSFSQAADEAGRSRIYGGIHYEFSNQDGQSLGRSVADKVIERFSLADDLIAPSIVFLSPTDNINTSTNPTIEGWVIDNLSGVASATVQVDNGASQPISLNASGRFTFTPSLPLNNSPNGSHTLRFTAIDKAGLQSSNFDFTFTLDTLVPTASITSPADGATITAGQLLEGTVSGTGSNLVSLTYQIDSGSRVPISFSSTGGSFSNSLDLSKVQPGSHTLKLTARDAAGLETTINRTFTISQLIPLTITDQTPSNGSSDIGSTFRPQVHFSRPINKGTLTPLSFYATDTTGTKLPATIVPAQDGSFAWLFFTNPMPGSSTITVHVDGDFVTGLDGTLLDADGNGTAGGKFTYSFTTVSLSSLPNTSIKGRVVDPGVDLKAMTRDDILAGNDGILHTSDDRFLNPIAGAKVFILGRESQSVTTDSEGFFELTSVPSGTIKLAVDGRTATNAPSGVFWPEMVMDLELIVGSVNTVMGTMGTREERAANLDRTEVYLPRLQTSILKPISNTTTTTVGVDSKSSPNLTNEQRSNLKLEVVPNSILGENGQPLTNAQIGISTVPPELVRDMLPPGLLQHTFDITIQAPGAATFNTPLQMKFPNVFNAAPGTQLSFLSFDHTTGRLVIEGTATVSPDGLSATTDVGSGITKPGWHGVTPPGSPGEPPCAPKTNPNLTVPPVPALPASGDHFLTASENSLSLRIANNAQRPNNSSSGSCDSTKATPMIVTVTLSDTGEEFLAGISSHSFTLAPSESRTITISSKDILDKLPKIVRNRLYGATIDIQAFRWGELTTPIGSEKINLYRFYDVSDSRPNDGQIQIPETPVDKDITSSPDTLAEVRSRLDKLEVTGVTVVTHGFQPQTGNGDSLLPLARAIHDKVGNGWLLDYDVNQGESGHFDTSEFKLPGDGDDVRTGELVLLFDWASESNETSKGWGDSAADALFSMLIGLGVVDPITPKNSKPLHFIGHSFGTAVTSQAVRRLGAINVPVDQVTYLDPHDFDQKILQLPTSLGIGIDTEQHLYDLVGPTLPRYGSAVWNNVAFTDVYYQTRNHGIVPPFGDNNSPDFKDNVVPAGRPIPGAFNVFLDSENELPFSQINYIPTPSPIIPFTAVLGFPAVIPVGSAYLDPNQELFGLGDSDHSYVWNQFYMATVTGVPPIGLKRPINFGSEGYQNTGWSRFSRIANGGLIAAQTRRNVAPTFFNNTNAPTSQDHRWSERYVANEDGTPASASDGWTSSKQVPDWNPFIFTNGDFEDDPEKLVSDIIPGWSHHGGGGNGNIKTIGDDGFLELSDGDEYRTHNWFYIPKTANTIQFDYKVDKTSRDDLLQVYIDDIAIGDPISLSNTIFFRERIAIPTLMKGSVHTLTFKIVSLQNGIESVVGLDNIRMSTEPASRAEPNVQFASTFEYALGTTPRPTVRFSASEVLKQVGTDTILFDPRDPGSQSAGNLVIGGNSPDQSITIRIPVTATAAQLSDDPAKKTRGPLAIYDNSEKGVFRNEFQLGSTGTASRKEYMLHNQGNKELILTRVSPSSSVLNGKGISTSLSDVSNLVLAPNQRIPFTVEYSGQSAAYDSAEFTFETGGGLGQYGDTRQFGFSFWVGDKLSTGSGEGPATSVVTGKPLSYGNDYVSIDFPSRPGAPPIRLRSDTQGNFEAFLPANEPYHFSVFDPDSGLIAHSYSTTSSSGVPTQLLTPYFERSKAKDTDSDGLPDDIEDAIGTSTLSSDTNGDGISDFASIKQGLDPLAGKPVITGILASLPLQGEAKQIVVQGDITNIEKQTAYIATGSYGLAIVDVSQFNKPTLLGQIDLPGDSVDVAYDASFGIAVVASRTGGVHFIDVANPSQPRLLQSVNASANGVKILDGFAYVAVGSELRSYDVLTGERIATLNLGGRMTGLALDGSSLFSMGIDKILRAIEIKNGAMLAKGTLTMPVGGGKLSVGGGVAYIPAGSGFTSGFATASISNTANLTLLSGIDGESIAAEMIVANGSGLAVSVGSVASPTGGFFNAIDVLNVSDATVTNNFVTRYALLSAPESVVIAGGIAFVANGSSGLSVVNYQPFDTRKQAPTISISVDSFSVDILPLETGIQVLEGTSIPITITTTDDVQVRSVELLVNGQVVRSTLSYPFGLSAIAPLLPIGVTAGTFVIQARTTDTGGNSALSNTLTIQVRRDTFAPAIDRFEVTLVDIDSTKTGIQVLEGTEIRSRFVASDSGGLASVELLLNGIVTQSQTRRSGFFAFTVPQLGVNELSRDVAVQVRATDRAGNVTISQPESFTVVPDTFAPKITSINLREGETKLLGGFWLNIDFDEKMDRSTLIESNFQLTGPSGANVFAQGIQVIGSNSVSVRYQFTTPGAYSLTIDAPKIFDRNGNPLDSSPRRIRFFTSSANVSLFPNETFGVGTNPVSVTMGDVNGDGKLDLITANLDSSDVSILLGNGDGSFAIQKKFDVGSGPISVKTGDVNRDGMLDVISANFRSGDVSVLLGNGDGTFAFQKTFGVGANPRSVATGDVNGDGKLDLITANGSDDASVLLGNGDGTFAIQKKFDLGSGPNAVTIGDANGDGSLDLMTANESSGDVSVLLGNGDGTFAAQLTFSAGSSPSSILTGDVNGDGRLDLITAQFIGGQSSVLLGNGDGTFAEEITFDVVSRPNSITAGDINSDGKLDLITSDSFFNTISVLLGNGDGTFASQLTFSGGSGPASIATGDVNGDGRLDLITANSLNNAVGVMQGNGDGTFQKSFAVGTNPRTVTTGDVNGDGSLDLITANSNSNDVSMLLGNGDGTFAVQMQFGVGSNPRSVTTGDVNNDGNLDVITANGNVSVLLGIGNGSFEVQRIFGVGSGPVSVVTVDVNRDGNLDLVSANRSSRDVSILLGIGDGNFADQVTFDTGGTPESVSTGDVNGDGNLDLITASDLGVSVLLGNGDGTFEVPFTFGAGESPISVITGDVNGDGNLDVITANFGSNDVSVLLGNGDGTFADQKRFGVNSNPVSIALGDLNGDGQLDLITANTHPSNDISVLLGIGDGMFAVQKTFGGIGTTPYSVTTGDVNGDNRLDLITANFGSNDVSVLINQSGSPLIATRVSKSDRGHVLQVSETQAQFAFQSTIQWWTGQGIAADRFSRVELRVSDLPNNQLGYANGDTIWLDDDAAGWGWFIDATPMFHEEFEKQDTQWISRLGESSLHMDLLTVLAHELGHILGLDDDHDQDGHLMSHTLDVGIRRLPGM